MISGIAAERGATNEADANPIKKEMITMPYMLVIKGNNIIETPRRISELIIIVLRFTRSAKTPAIGAIMTQGIV
ncbi:hypothetical protein ES708_22459 [subsurface metagenome]